MGHPNPTCITCTQCGSIQLTQTNTTCRTWKLCSSPIHFKHFKSFKGVFDLHTNPNPIHLNRLYRLLNLIHFCCRSNLRGLWLIYVKCRLNRVKMVTSGLTTCWDSIQYFATLIMITRSNSDSTHSIPKNFKIVGPFVMIVNYYKWIEYEYFTEFFYSLLLW